MPIASLPQPQRADRSPACVLCQQRRSRCDRKSPCSTCVKANVTCITKSHPRRRRLSEDLRDRLARCEALLMQYSHNIDDPSSTRPSASSQKSAPAVENTLENGFSTLSIRPRDAALELEPPATMIHGDGGAQHLASSIWATMHNELQLMKQILDTQVFTEETDSTAVSGSSISPETSADASFLGHNADHMTSNNGLEPTPVQAFQLWQTFLERVNPVTKVIHVPSLQPYVVEAVKDMNSLSFSYQALVFAIYTMATMSMEDHESVKILGVSREKALRNFTAGAQIALVQSNFLKTHDMTTLQALVLYLHSLQERYDYHALWFLSGTVVRIAQMMGYHRDGEDLGLSPFETQMRRRIWWQVMKLDARITCHSGQTHTILNVHADSKLPVNANDADLIPTSTQPIQEREGATEMAYFLMSIETYKFFVPEYSLKSLGSIHEVVMGREASTVAAATETLKDYNLKLIRHYRQSISMLEKRLIDMENRYLDLGMGNLYTAAISIRPTMVNRLKAMLIPMYEQPEWGTEILTPKENLFKIVVSRHEHETVHYEAMAAQGLLWVAKENFDLKLFGMMTGQLCCRPMGSLADRAWNVVDKIYQFHPELLDVSQKRYYDQAQFTLKAWQVRMAACEQAGQVVQTKVWTLRLQALVVAQDSLSFAAKEKPLPFSADLQPISQADDLALFFNTSGSGGGGETLDTFEPSWNGATAAAAAIAPANTSAAPHDVSAGFFSTATNAHLSSYEWVALEGETFEV